jgi:glycosyltransferase involved in cell wall biosynthesis
MAYDIRIVSSYPPRRCGIGTFSRDLASALEHFNTEVDHIRVAAIDNENQTYHIPVDLTIEQYNPKSWADTAQRIVTGARETEHYTVILLQHEYGLDPDARGNDARGNNYVRMAKVFRENGLTTLVYLHTVLDEPNPHQKKVIRDLAQFADGLIVTTESAIQILESDTYGVDPLKLKHIDNGIRMHSPSQFDRLEIKKELGLENHFLVTTLGLLSPDKGLQYSIRAYGRFVSASCTAQQRKRIVYIIAGQCHPEFVKARQGAFHREYQKTLNQALDDAELKWCRVDQLDGVDFSDNDVVFYDTFLSETDLLNFYGATNVMVLPYLNLQQISSGILADTLGSGRAAITTKFRYAVELIHSNMRCPPGVLIGRHSRGILVDPQEPSVEQIAKGLDYVVFKKNNRLMMERQAHQRGYQMSWNNSAWGLLQYIDFVKEQKEIVTGRGLRFVRRKPSPLQILLSQVPETV